MAAEPQVTSRYAPKEMIDEFIQNNIDTLSIAIIGLFQRFSSPLVTGSNVCNDKSNPILREGFLGYMERLAKWHGIDLEGMFTEQIRCQNNQFEKAGMRTRLIQQ